MQPIDERPSVPHDNAPFTMPAETAQRIAELRRQGAGPASDKVPVLEAARHLEVLRAGSSPSSTSRSPSARARSTASLGDNGAGKSTLIKTLSGVHPPDTGSLCMDGQPVTLQSPRDALDRGIATVYQDLAVLPLMSISRNFFVGSEPTRGWGPVRRAST